MEKIFKKEAAKIKENIAEERLELDATNSVYQQYIPLTYEEKSILARVLSEISKETLTNVVRAVLEKCPQAVKEGKNAKSSLEIELNLMDRPTFNSAKDIIQVERPFS